MPTPSPAEREPAAAHETSAPSPEDRAAASGAGAGDGAGAAPAPTPLGKDKVVERMESAGVLAQLPSAWIRAGADDLHDGVTTDEAAYDRRIASSGVAAVLSHVTETEKAFLGALDYHDPIAKQKEEDVDAEQYMDLTPAAVARQKFYQHVESKIRAAIRSGTYNRNQIYAPYMQSAGKDLGLKFQGVELKPSEWSDFPNMLSRNTGVFDVWEYGIGNKGAVESAVVADYTGAGLPAPVGPDLTAKAKEKFAEDVNGKDIVGGATIGKLNPGASASYGAGWFTPDQIQANDTATNGFADAMSACSLQPEWYPDGTVVIEFARPAGVTIRKPTAYDGLMSAMWVARNQPNQQWGVLGSGLREALVGGMTYASATKAVGHIPPAHYTTNLNQAKVDYERQNVSHLRRAGSDGGSLTEQIARNTGTNNPLNPTPDDERPDGRFGAVKLGHRIVDESNQERQNPTAITPMTPVSPTTAGGSGGGSGAGSSAGSGAGSGTRSSSPTT